MFFIFGSPRSGTTLLAQCLNAHPAIVIPDETDFIIPAAFIFDRVGDLAVRRGLLKELIVNAQRFAGSIGAFLSPAQVAEIVDAHAERADRLLVALYSAVARSGGAALAGDKSPNDLLFLRMLVKVGGISPDAKIIHVVRDVRDVLASIASAKMTNAPEQWFPRLWGASNLYLRDLYRGSDQYLLVRYEAFVRAPEETLREVSAHLAVSYDPAMLDPDRRHPRYRSVASHGKLYQPISDRYVGAYRSSLSKPLVEVCERQAGEALRVFGTDRR